VADPQLIIPPAPVVNEIPNRSGDAANPLRDIDRYGLSGAGPIPGVTLGCPLGQEGAASGPAAGEGPAPQARPFTTGKAAGSVTTAGGEDKQKAQQKAAQAAKKTALAAKKAVNKAVANSEGKPLGPPVLERPQLLKEATLMMGAGQYDQALKAIEKVLSVD